MDTTRPKYIHQLQAHNLGDPSIIVPVIMDVLQPRSVVDIGCGIGTFLHVFRQHGVQDIFGVDADWVDRALLFNHIPADKFLVADLEKEINLGRRFDLALCLEVAEHLHSESASLIVQNLVQLSDYILFSAAIPGQMGQNHLNEQWPVYWMEKFQQHGYSFYDVLRPIFWNNGKLARWYKQNVFLVVKDVADPKAAAFAAYDKSNMLDYVHPEYYSLRVKELIALSEKNNSLHAELSRIKAGRASLKIYLKLLTKYIASKFNGRN